MVIGTTGYMSPEQSQGLPVDARTDVWSLGIVIYEMATGRLPSAVAQADRGIVADADTPALEELADVPSALARIVSRALSRERADRYATARDVAAICARSAARRSIRQMAPRSGRPADAVAREPYTVAVRRRRIRSRRRDGLSRGRRAAAGRARHLLDRCHAARTRRRIRDGEYLADGIAASLRSRLAQFSSIRQAAASESARYERLGVSPAQAGREMRVAAVLTGALDRRADTVIVRLELVRSADGAGLWNGSSSETDRRRPDPADRDRPRAGGCARYFAAAPGDRQRRDPGSCRLSAVRQGRYHVLRRTPDDLRKGLEYLREAVALDPATDARTQSWRTPTSCWP